MVERGVKRFNIKEPRSREEPSSKPQPRQSEVIRQPKNPNSLDLRHHSSSHRPLLISRSGRKLVWLTGACRSARLSHSSPTKQTGVAMAPPAVMTIICQIVPQPI